MKLRTIITISLIGLFLVGSGIIIYQGRPVQKLKQQQVKTVVKIENQADSRTVNKNNIIQLSNSSSQSLSFSQSEIQRHNTSHDCWTAIDGNVYDLSTWVSRHPGGSQAIINLCGINGSQAFNRQHGDSNSAKYALSLLKIGNLQ